MAVQFKEKGAYEEAGALVAVNERVVADDTRDVGGSHFYDVRVVAISMQLLRSCESGLKQTCVTQASSAAVQREKAVMEREGVTLIDPGRLTHLAKPFRLLREGV